MDDIKVDLEINCQHMAPETYEVIQFPDGSIKIKAVYHNQEGFAPEDE